jgi:Fe-S cluster assembly scaffold protein SufB
MAYFSDLAITKLSDQQERQQAQLLATRIADTVEHHIKREKNKLKRERRKRNEPLQEAPGYTTIQDWSDVQEEIEDTISKSNPQLAEVRVFQKVASNQWAEAIRMPVDAGALSAQEEQRPGSTCWKTQGRRTSGPSASFSTSTKAKAPPQSFAG